MAKTVVITPSTADLPEGWSVGRFREALQGAADAWNDASVACGVKLVVGEPRSEWRAARDGTNLVAFRSRTWCHNERCSPTSTYPLRAMAMTTPYPGNAERPEEADVEINAVSFRLTAGDDAGVSATPKWSAPIVPVLVHEIGHVLGLPDVCGGERRASGRPVMSGCSAEDRQRVMFAANASERPAPADVAELCRLYQPADARLIESAPAGPAPVPGSGVGSSLLLALLAIGLVLVAGRRVRRALRWISGRRDAAPSATGTTPDLSRTASGSGR
jgi:hypothetical protein